MGGTIPIPDPSYRSITHTQPSAQLGRCAPAAPLTPFRSPDEANVRNKMIYASSKDAIHRRLEGIHIDLQATDYSEITKETSECAWAGPIGRVAIHHAPLLTPSPGEGDPPLNARRYAHSPATYSILDTSGTSPSLRAHATRCSGTERRQEEKSQAVWRCCFGLRGRAAVAELRCKCSAAQLASVIDPGRH